MRVTELTGGLARRGAYLRILDDGRIEYVGPRGLLTDELRAEIRTRREEIIAWLRTPIHALPKQNRLALDYEPTLPREYLDSIWETHRKALHRESLGPLVDVVREWLEALRECGIRPAAWSKGEEAA